MIKTATGQIINLHDLPQYSTVRIEPIPHDKSPYVLAAAAFWPIGPNGIVCQDSTGANDCCIFKVGDIIVFMDLRSVQITYVWGEGHINSAAYAWVMVFLFHGQLCWTHYTTFNRLSAMIVGA